MDQKIEVNKIVNIFKTMEYGESENMEQNNKFRDWLETKKKSIFTYVNKSNEEPNGTPVMIKSAITDKELCTIFTPDIDIIKNILSKECKSSFFNNNGLERASILDKLALEIEKNADLFIQIEAQVRGIITKTTKNKSVPLLAQYFYYYSCFPVSYEQENPKWKPDGIATGIIANENPLSNLGLFLAPALAAGYNVVLQIGSKLSLAACLILELGKKVGLPEDALRLIPSDGYELSIYLNSERVTILTLFVDLQNEKYIGINSSNKKIISLSTYKIPTIVFDSADLDSACENIIDLAWSNLTSWSTDTILVQENCYLVLLNKLKSKLKSIKVGNSTNKMVDISFGDNNSLQKLRTTIQKAKCQGVEVFQADAHGNYWTPTLIIGTKVENNCTLRYNERNGSSAVTVSAFRSIDEAVNLANNTDQGFAASVWSENVGVVNEVAKKLKVSTVWVNGSSGFISADVTFSPLKKSGVGYFGGREGFYEYVQIQKNTPIYKHPEEEKMEASITPIINSARKAQQSWSQTPRITRGRQLRNLVGSLQTKKGLISSNIDEKCLDIWLKETYVYTSDSVRDSYTSIHSGYNLMTFRDPRGVIYVDSFHSSLVIMALFEGNAILVMRGSPGELFCRALSEKLPPGLINILPSGLDTVKKVMNHNGIDCYLRMWYPIYPIFALHDAVKFRYVTSSERDIYTNVTVPKNVWCDIGKSSNFNL